MANFDDLCIKLLDAVIRNYKRYLDDNKRDAKAKQTILTQKAIFQEMWDQMQDQQGYRDKELLVRALRELENLGWIKSREGTQNEQLYYPTKRSLAPAKYSYYSMKYRQLWIPMIFTIAGGILGILMGTVYGFFLGFLLWLMLWASYKVCSKGFFLQ